MQLATREKIYVSIALVAVIIFALLQFIVFPFFEKKGRIKRGIGKKEEALNGTQITRIKRKNQPPNPRFVELPIQELRACGTTSIGVGRTGCLPGPPSLRTGRAVLPHPALQSVVLPPGGLAS